MNDFCDLEKTILADDAASYWLKKNIADTLAWPTADILFDARQLLLLLEGGGHAEPCAKAKTDWLQPQLYICWCRDKVDAINDVEALIEALKARGVSSARP